MFAHSLREKPPGLPQIRDPKSGLCLPPQTGPSGWGFQDHDSSLRLAVGAWLSC